MKILYHHRTLSQDGQDVHIQEMIAALRRRGHEVILVEPTKPRSSTSSTGGSSSRLRRLLPKRLSEILELAYSVPAYFRLLSAWRRHRPDILYERYNLFLLSGVWLKAQTGIPMLLEVNAPLYEERRTHGGLSWPKLARWTETKAWRRADALLPVTHVLASHLQNAGAPEDRIHVIANGVDAERFPPDIKGNAMRRELNLEKKLVLGFTGFIRPWHGLARVVEVIASLRERSDLHLLVVGDGPGRSEIEERARALGVAERVTIVGTVPRDRVASYVATFDIALQPHVVSYASPLKLFEYMALGRAIVAIDQPNIREVLSHDSDALLFDPRDPTAFPAAIARLCNDPDLRIRLGLEAARTIERRGFRWIDNAAKVEKIARGLIGPRHDQCILPRDPILSGTDR